MGRSLTIMPRARFLDRIEVGGRRGPNLGHGAVQPANDLFRRDDAVGGLVGHQILNDTVGQDLQPITPAAPMPVPWGVFWLGARSKGSSCAQVTAELVRRFIEELPGSDPHPSIWLVRDREDSDTARQRPRVSRQSGDRC